MRILGIDPGLRITGYACVEGSIARPNLIEAGVFRLGRRTGGEIAPIPDRLHELDQDLAELIDRTRPAVLAVEAVFAHVKHPATAIAMAHARGVILLSAKKASLRLLELRPAEVKKFLTGNGQARKPQMQSAVQAFLQLPAIPEPPDLADAIAIALCASSRAAGPLPELAARRRPRRVRTNLPL
jgi:crossover junction endodeoxyribonuclease RuvC